MDYIAEPLRFPLSSPGQRHPDRSLLMSRPWVKINDAAGARQIYIFHQNNELLVAQNGSVEKAKWELPAEHLLMIDTQAGCSLYQVIFLDEEILVLQTDGETEQTCFVKEDEQAKCRSLADIKRYLQKKYAGAGRAGEINRSPAETAEPAAALDSEIIRKHRKWSLLKGKVIELSIEFTDRDTGKVRSRGKVFYQVRKKQFSYILANRNMAFPDINSCLQRYKKDMSKMLSRTNH